jgi:hypothetical protein
MKRLLAAVAAIAMVGVLRDVNRQVKSRNELDMEMSLIGLRSIMPTFRVYHRGMRKPLRDAFLTATKPARWRVSNSRCLGLLQASPDLQEKTMIMRELYGHMWGTARHFR